MQHMNKAALYSVDSNRPATAKQCYAVGNHFGKIHASTPSEAFRLGKVFAAILLKFNAEHCETPITHGDISRFFELETVPQKFLERISVRAPNKTSKKSKVTKAEKTSTKSPEPSKKVIKARKTSTKSEEATKPKASEMSVSEFEAKLQGLQKRVHTAELSIELLEEKTEAHDKRLASMDAKLDILMAWLETNPEL